MKSNGNLQYVADTYFLEQLLSSNQKISVAQEGGVFSSVFDSVKDATSSLIDTSSTGSIIKSVLKILEAGQLFRIHWMLGALDVVAQGFGISLTDILASIVGKLRGKIESGQPVSPAEVNQAAMGVGESVASFDFSEFGFVKIAAWGRRNQGGDWEWLKSKLSGAPAYKQKKFFSVLVGWLVKTVLAGAGLLIGGKMIAGLLGGGNKPEEIKPQTEIQQTTLTQTPEGLTPSGTGEEDYTGKIWYEPIDGDIQNTVLDWAEEIYPDFVGYDGIISKLPSFQRVITELKAGFDPRKPMYMAMPKKYRRRVDVINQFAADAINKIKGMSNV